MLKLMENDYVHHWNMLQLAKESGWAGTQEFHEGVCYGIERYYAILLDCTVDEARDRMQKRIRGETC
jgi:hypothetical protein